MDNFNKVEVEEIDNELQKLIDEAFEEYDETFKNLVNR